jgi:hypothetical protein
LLAPLDTIGLDRLTTKVNFTKVHVHESVFLRECGLRRANL